MIDGATSSTATIPVGTEPYAVTVNQITNRIYVANRRDNTVTVLDGATNTAGAIVTVGMLPLSSA